MFDPACLAPVIPDPLWVFAYGSLMWQPDFPVIETHLASLHGWQRSFCMWSIHHRGSLENPGLVLALDREEGALCQGVALRVDPRHAAETLERLRERELVSSAYFEVNLTLDLGDGQVQALGYVMNRAHAQYAQNLDLAAQAHIIAHAQGGRGSNRDYLFATHRQLQALGIEDPDMAWLNAKVQALVAG